MSPGLVHQQTLRSVEIVLWLARATQDAAAAWEWAVSEDQRRRLESRIPVERMRRLVSLAMRRTVIADALERKVLDVTVGSDPAGRPTISEAQDLRISASHYDDMTALAVARGVSALGVDLEPLDESGWEDALEDVLTPDELAALRALPAPDQASAYFACWTCKEAVMKALGEGLADRAPNTVEVSIPPDPPGLRALEGKPPKLSWTLATLRIEEGYVLSVAVPDRVELVLRLRRWPLDLPAAEG